MPRRATPGAPPVPEAPARPRIPSPPTTPGCSAWARSPRPGQQPVSPATFQWILTILITAGSLWALFDVVKLARTRRDDPDLRDKRFGYLIGITPQGTNDVWIIDRRDINNLRIAAQLPKEGWSCSREFIAVRTVLLAADGGPALQHVHEPDHGAMPIRPPPVRAGSDHVHPVHEPAHRESVCAAGAAGRPGPRDRARPGCAGSATANGRARSGL